MSDLTLINKRLRDLENSFACYISRSQVKLLQNKSRLILQLPACDHFQNFKGKHRVVKGILYLYMIKNDRINNDKNEYGIST